MKKKIGAAITSGLLLICLTIASLFLEELGLIPPADLPQETQSTQPAPESTGLTVHFLDVGQADSILLECDGRFALIDGGNVDDGQMVVSYMQQQGVEELDRVICTHAHEDHVGGLPSVLAVFPTHAIHAPTKTYASKCFDNFMYYADQQKQEVTLPEPGTVFPLGSASITILGPVKTYAETNDTSIVCLVKYGENSFLFTGDMEKEAELDMLDSGAQVKADVLKMGHHGSDTSSGYRFLYEVDPMYTVICVGTDNSYGHPHEEPMSRLNHAGTVIFRTDLMGTILAHSDGKEITFTWDNQSASPVNAEYTGIYIGNKNSLKVHSENCESLPGERNRVEFAALQEALDAGYTPCTGCIG